MVSKYFRKAGVPQIDDDGNQTFDEAGQPVLGPERSAKQVIDRLAGCWRHWGENHGYFASTEDARRSRTSSPTCSSTRWRRPTPRSGSTPGSPGPTASPAPPRASIRRSRRRRGEGQPRRLHPPVTPCLLHPVGERRPGEPRWDHGPLGPRGAHLQVRLRHRDQLLRRSAARASRSPAAARPPV